ncbi:MAG: YkgJ family cysteine cluster protein [PVC group bacterium]|nr:YkgJ family cysteine cluster protein [PVC group bacterium]
MQNLKTDLYQIAQLAKDQEEENLEFSSFLRSGLDSQKIDEIVKSLYDQVLPRIDCTSCGNCCELMDPVFKEKDILKLSKCWKDKNIRDHLIEDREENEFMFNNSPCPFLKESKCLEYSSRPEGCKSYPHLHKEGFISRLVEVMESYSICPIVFNVYESLKVEVYGKC